MEINVVYLVFLLLPLLFGACGFLFFIRYRQHKQTTWRWTRLIFGNLIVLGLLLSICILAGETYFRFWYDTTDSFGLSMTHQDWMQRHYNGGYNNARIRDNMDYDRAIPDGQHRVSFVGDSFTLGHGIKNVNDRFVNRVRRQHPEWNVHVLGNVGYDTEQEFEMLGKMAGAVEVSNGQRLRDPARRDPCGRFVLVRDQAGLPVLGRDRNGRVVMRDQRGALSVSPDINGWFADAYQFDYVVLVFCLNDIADEIPEWPGILKRIYEDSKPGWLGTHSYLFNTIHYRLYSARDPDLARFCQFTHAAYDPGGKIWPVYRDRLISLRDLVRTAGGELLVVTFPYMDQLGSDYPYHEVHRQLDQFWTQLKVPHLDLRTAFEQDLSQPLVVNRFDAHPNERAHQIAAKAIGDFLQQHVAAESRAPRLP